ncbi:MAG: hypothetical protein IPL52_11790 [Flavobacteriales bacterium]|nr:hypothetical protein [Flavobacteriales bacterium]
MVNNLRTLSILHYVYGALVCLGGAAMLMFIFIGAMLNSDMMQQQDDPPPELVGGFMQVFGWVLFVIIEIIGILILLSGSWIAKRRNRTGSLVIAGFCCLNFPLGTALGIFTFVTLLNEEVKREYDRPALPVS